MENLYNRVENLDEQIASVKLPYMAWKVLFLVDKDSESNKIASILEADANEVNSSLALLVENNLISQSAGSVSDTTEEPEKEEVSEIQPETAQEEKIESPTEDASEEPTSEVEAPVSDDDEFDVVTETTEATAEEAIEEIPEAEDSVVEAISAEENEPVSTEEEDIEIKISEEEEAAPADDNEFNFNLTGDDDEAIKEESIEAPEEQTSSEVAEEQIDTTPADTTGRKNILVIDDSLVIRKMVEIALEDEDYIISTAVSGKEGLDSLDKINPDLVILDMMLPDINGIEILKTIKASKGIPVIMLSGKDSPQMIESAKNEGAEEFLPKPFKDDDLVEKIKNLL